MLTIRLHTYHFLLGKYDLLDKHKTISSLHFSLKQIKIHCSFCKLSTNTLNTLTIKEFFYAKKIYFNKTYKNTSYFLVSFRKRYLFLFLEALTNSLFLKTKLNLKEQQDSLQCFTRFYVTEGIQSFFLPPFLAPGSFLVNSNFTFMFSTKFLRNTLVNYLFLPLTENLNSRRIA